MWLFVYGFLASLAAGYGAQLRAGGPGHAAYFGDLQGFHVPHFPMPSWFVTIDVWLKINKVFSRTAIDATVWSYSVFDGDTELPYHFELMVTDVCHDACAPIDTTVIHDGRWHHLALSWDLHFPASLYLDGQFVQKVVVPAKPHPMIPGGVLFLGQETGAFSAYGGSFIDFDAPLGQIDNFRVHSSALSALEVRALMYLPATGDGLVKSTALVASFTFDEDYVETVELWDGTTRIVSVLDSTSNLTMYGGCYLCVTNATMFPLLTVSDCPVITTASTPYRYPPVSTSVHIFVPLLFSLTAPCDEVDALMVDVIFHSESSDGEFFPLLSPEVPYSGSVQIEMFNGTLRRRLDPSVLLGIADNTCEVHGAGALLFSTASSANATLAYSVDLRSLISNVSISVNSIITFVQGRRVYLSETAEVKAAVSMKSQFQSGLVPLDGSIPMSCLIVSLPSHGWLEQSDGRDVYLPGTKVTDGICRMHYQPDGYVRGKGADRFEFKAAPGFMPLSRVMYFNQDWRDGLGVARPIHDFVEDDWAHYVLASDGSIATLPRCLEGAVDYVSVTKSFGIAPSESAPVTHGWSGLFSDPAYLNLTLVRGLNATSVTIDDKELYAVSAWISPNLTASRLQAESTLFAGQGNCWKDKVANVSSYTYCERFALTMRNDSFLTLKVKCIAGNDRMFSQTVPYPWVSHWSFVAVVWNHAFSVACVYVNGTSVLCQPPGFTCQTWAGASTSNRSESDLRITDVVVGARMESLSQCGRSGGRYRSNGLTCSHFQGRIDDISILSLSDRSLLPQLLDHNHPIDWADEHLELPEGLAAMCAITFDHPLSMLWQPSIVRRRNPAAFNFDVAGITREEDDEYASEVYSDEAESIAEYLGLEDDDLSGWKPTMAAMFATTLSDRRSLASKTGKTPRPVFVGVQGPAALMPRLAWSNAPYFREYRGVEEKPLRFHLPGYNAVNRQLTARIVEFPAHGTLHQTAGDRLIGPPVSKLPTLASQTPIVQYASRVVRVSSEWTVTDAYLESINATLDDVYAGRIPQSEFGSCYCSLGILGPPDCDTVMRDCATTWAPEELNQGVQYVDLQYEQAVIVNQVQVMIPEGGQVVVQILAQSPQGSWVRLFHATRRDLDFTKAAGDPGNYVAFYANPCSTSFRADTIRVVFDTDLCLAWLEVDAVKLIGTLDTPVGVVSGVDRELIYVPDPDFYGYDSFSYIVSDCPYQDHRQSDITALSVRYEGVNDAPTIKVRDFNVSSATSTKFTLEFADIDSVSAVGIEPAQEKFGLKILTVPTMGALNIRTGGSWFVMAPVIKDLLPLTRIGQSIPLQLVPTSKLETMPKLCGYIDEFQVVAFNPDATVDAASPPITIRLHFQCDLPVCAAGEEAIHLQTGHACVACGKGSYNTVINGTCLPCPFGGVCEGGSHIAAKTGYWELNRVFYPCDNALTCCPKGPCNATDPSRCAPGLTGMLCMDCQSQDEYLWGGKCVKCSGLGAVTLFVCTVIALIVVLALLTSRIDSVETRFKQFVDYIQLVNVILMSLPNTIQLAVRNMGIAGVISMDARSLVSLLSLPCITPLSPISRHIMLSYGQPALLFLVWLIVFWSVRLHYTRKHLRFPRRPFYHALWQILVLCYTSLNYTGLSLLNCKDVGDHRVLIQDNSVKCEGLKYRVAVGVGIAISASISIVVPVLIYIAHKRQVAVPVTPRNARIGHKKGFGRLFGKSAPVTVEAVPIGSCADDLTMADKRNIGGETCTPRTIASKASGLSMRSKASGLSLYSVPEHSRFNVVSINNRSVKDILKNNTPRKRYQRSVVRLSLNLSKRMNGSAWLPPTTPALATLSMFQFPVNAASKRLISRGVKSSRVVPTSVSAPVEDCVSEDIDGDDNDGGHVRSSESCSESTSNNGSTASEARSDRVVPAEEQTAGSTTGPLTASQKVRPNIPPLHASHTVDLDRVMSKPPSTMSTAASGLSMYGTIDPSIQTTPADDLSSTFDDDTASTAPQAPTSLRTRSYNVLQAVTERTCIYNDSVRLWFESYFLTRRTVLITLSVGLCNYPIQRAQAIFLALLLAFVVQMVYTPFSTANANFMQSIILIVLCGISGYEMVLATISFDTPDHTERTLSEIPNKLFMITIVVSAIWIMFYILRAFNSRVKILWNLVSGKLVLRRANRKRTHSVGSISAWISGQRRSSGVTKPPVQ